MFGYEIYKNLNWQKEKRTNGTAKTILDRTLELISSKIIDDEKF